MRAGPLRHRISIINPKSTSRSTDGAPVVTYTTVVQTWAAVESLTGREPFLGSYRWSEDDKRFTIRYSTENIQTKMNIVFNGSTYNIISIADTDNRHRELVMIATKTT